MIGEEDFILDPKLSTRIFNGHGKETPISVEIRWGSKKEYRSGDAIASRQETSSKGLRQEIHLLFQHIAQCFGSIKWWGT
jgi:hypothetical protein